MEFSKLVPQIFFDVIARIVPGSAALVGWAIAGKWKLAEDLLEPFGDRPWLDSSSLFFLLVFLGASYVLGHLFGPLSHQLEKAINSLFTKQLSILTELIDKDTDLYPEPICQFFAESADVHLSSQGKSAEVSDSGQKKSTEKRAQRQRVRHHTSLVYVWLDCLRLEDPDLGARLVKIRAEVKMQSQLAVAAGSVALFHLIAAWEYEAIGLNCAILVISAALSLFSMANYYRLFRILQLSILNHYYALQVNRDF